MTDYATDAASVSLPEGGRDFWRSALLHEISKQLGYTGVTLEPKVARLKDFAGALRDLLDELTDQELRFGRSMTLHTNCRRRCEEIARAYIHLAQPGAPVLFIPLATAAA